MSTKRSGNDPARADQDDPENVVELDDLRRKLSRLNKDAEMLGEAMRQKPKKS
jgi:hypothetical protein